MGSKLRRDLREVLPAGIKGLQRAIALEIADDARYDDAWRYNPERGRCSKARLADLVRWTGAKDELTVREMLRRLSVAGWEFRVPIGKDKNGNVLFAVPGRAMQFRVPDFEGPTVVGPSDGEGPTTVAEGPTTVAEGPTVVVEGPTVVVEGPTTVGSPSPVLPSSSHQDPPSSPAETEPASAPTVTDGGGGGGGGSDLRSIAEHIAANLQYFDQVPDKQQLRQLTAALVAVLEKGWPVDVLAAYLRLGNFRPDNPVGFYLAKLTTKLPSSVPTRAAPSSAARGVRGPMPDASVYADLTLEDVFGPSRAAPVGGTDGNVAAWMKLSRDLGRKQPHKPFRNYTDDSVYDEPFPLPAGSAPLWCGEPECNETDRMRDGIGGDGLPNVYPCPKCHPDRQQPAA